MSTCAICVEDTESPVCCIPCGHVYCHECIDNWQKSQKSVSRCPECRKRIQNVMAIYIKRDDSQDEVKELIKRNEELQQILEDCYMIKVNLERDLKFHKESILRNKEEQKRIIDQLEEEQQNMVMYRDQSRAFSKEKKDLQKKNVIMQKRLNTMEDTSNTYLIKIEELGNEIRALENQWSVRMMKKTDEVIRYVSVIPANIRKKMVCLKQYPVLIYLECVYALKCLCLKCVEEKELLVRIGVGVFSIMACSCFLSSQRFLHDHGYVFTELLVGIVFICFMMIILFFMLYTQTSMETDKTFKKQLRLSKSRNRF